MIIIDPVALGDVAFTRPSPRCVYDRFGMLVDVPANTLGVTYDPSDLSKAPYALIEPEMVNLLRYSERLDASPVWGGTNLGIGISAATSPDGGMTAERLFATAVTGAHYHDQEISGNFTNGTTYTYSIFLKADTLNRVRLDMYYAIGSVGGASAFFNLQSGVVETKSGDGVLAAGIQRLPNNWYRCYIVGAVGYAALYPTRLLARTLLLRNTDNNATWPGSGSEGIFAWGAQLVVGETLGSYIRTTDAPAIRAADVIAPGAGLVYSNVPITEPNYDITATYAKDVIVQDPATHNTFQSLVDSNKGRALTNTTYWTPRGATNQRAMLDQYNNTQTLAADEILIVASPEAISQGFYIGNTYADEVRVSVVDQVEGVVYRETSVLLESNSESSFFNWAFKRIKRRDYFVTLAMLPYANALITVNLQKIGGTARCGMCAIGPTDEFGPTLMDLSTEGKDYSSTTFNFDGTSNTVLRPYAKKMTCDVKVDNRQIEYLQARLFELRQKPIVWIGGPYGITAVFGRYASFKNVIKYTEHSNMNLTLEGAV